MNKHWHRYLLRQRFIRRFIRRAYGRDVFARPHSMAAWVRLSYSLWLGCMDIHQWRHALTEWTLEQDRKELEGV